MSLESVDDLWRLTRAVADFQNSPWTYRQAFQSLRDFKGRGLYLFFSTWMADADIRNGGFRQYFYNDTSVGVDGAIAGFKAIGQERAAATVLEALLRHVVATPDDDRFNRPFIETAAREHLGISVAREYSRLEEVFYALRYDLGADFVLLAAKEPDQFLRAGKPGDA